MMAGFGGRSMPRRQLGKASAVAALAAVAAVASLGAVSTAAALPKEAPIFRSVETKRRRENPSSMLPDYYGRHPCPPKEEILSQDIPGGVQRRTVREQNLRKALSKGERPEPEDFDKVIQVFAQRARQELKWLAVQRREFIRRAKRWATEMLLQEMEPSSLTVRLMLLGCASTGDVAGAEYWFGWMENNGREVGRLEYNAVITAHGTEGHPEQALAWTEKMREAGIEPDAKSHAGIVEAYEKLGNRRRMLEALVQLQSDEAAGKLGAPLDEADAALPYYAMARSYMKVGDANRALSVLKSLKDKGVPLSAEAHKMRLESHLKVPAGPRRSIEEIEKAFVDLVNERKEGMPLYNSKMAAQARKAIGVARYHRILESLGTVESDIVAETPDYKDTELFRKASIQAALKNNVQGQSMLHKRNDDEAYLRKRKQERKPARIGEVAGGYRVPSEKGLPEWMTLQKPERFGG